MKLGIKDQGHMNKMAAMAINSKTVKNIFLQNRNAYGFETWQEASSS